MKGLDKVHLEHYTFYGKGVQGLEDGDPTFLIYVCRFLLNGDIEDW